MMVITGMVTEILQFSDALMTFARDDFCIPTCYSF
jgi:hypothetical protein